MVDLCALAFNNTVDIADGIIDPNHKGQVKLVLINNSQKKFEIYKGDVIAQIIFEHAVTPVI